MIEVGIHEAKTHLSRLLRQVVEGEEVVIKRGQQPVARLVPASAAPRRVLGQDEGLLWISDDFDDPLPDELLDLFEGR